jgi:glucokinase
MTTVRVKSATDQAAPVPASRSTERVFIGADVGGTTTAAGLVSESGEVLSFVREATHGRGRGMAVETLVGVVTGLAAESARRGLTLGGVGIGLPGLVDASRGMVVSSGNLVPEFFGIPLADQLETALGTPVFVDNDVNALALGEWRFGAGRQSSSLAVLALGTGVGGAMIVNGQLLRGEGGSAGEFGHAPIDFRGAPCVCGGRGCLCLYVSGEFMARAARERIDVSAPSPLLTLAEGVRERITCELVFGAAAAGDPFAGELVSVGCQALGAGIAAIVNSLDPGLVIVTGGVARSFALLETEVLRAVKEYALAEPLAHTRIQIAGSDKRRTVLGGAALALYELGRRVGEPGASLARSRS